VQEEEEEEEEEEERRAAAGGIKFLLVWHSQREGLRQSSCA